MIKIIALYTKPADEEAFLRHYEDVHTPLVRRVPGLAKLEVTRLTRDPLGGDPAYFLMAEMSYPDEQTFRAAMRSPENAAVVADVGGFARGLVTLVQGVTHRLGDPASGAPVGAAGAPEALRAGETVPEPGRVLEQQHAQDESSS